MATMATPAPAGDRPVSAGTTMRFALLVVLILVTSGLMLLYMAYWWVSKADAYRCSLAAGVDPDHATDLQIIVSRSTQSLAYLDCQRRYAQPPPWWVPLSCLVLLSVAAVALFYWLPVWKARRGRAVPLTAVDHDGEIRRVLEEVAAVAGLDRMPRVLVDPTAASVGALVFGRNGRPIMSLHGGLLARRHRDPEGFRAVLLHEFAHIRNGDVTLTYATVALWRVFLTLVTPPFLVGLAMYLVYGVRLGSPVFVGPSRSFLQTAFLVVLVYLARSDVLRSREIHADRTAVRWGADLRGWHVGVPPSGDGALRRRLASFVALWRTHPRWDLRRDALTDSGPVYGVPALPMFLTGAAATLISSQLALALTPYTQQTSGTLTAQTAALAAAGIATGVAGITLWRAVIHAVLTGRRPPSGVRAGLWLGAGMAAGTLVTGQGTIEQFFPSQNARLVQFLIGGPAFTWWTAQCAQLWVRRWRGRTIRPMLTAGLAAGGLALAQWLTWWQVNAPIGTGWWYEPVGVRRWLEQAYPGPAGDHGAVLSGISAVFPVVLSLNGAPLAAAAAAALWVVPLAAWTTRSASAALPWTRAAALDIEGAVEPAAESLPRLRGVLLPGLLCGAGGWAVVVTVLAYLHSGVWGAPPQGASLQGLVFFAWTYVGLTTTAVTAAVVAAVRASRYRLLRTLIAAQTAAVMGLAGLFVLLSFDGCIDRLSLTQSSCAWRPSRILDWQDLRTVLDFTLTTVTIAGLVVAAVVSAVRRVRTFRQRRPAAADPPGRAGSAFRRVCLGTLCAAVLTVSVIEAAHQQERTLQKPDLRTFQKQVLQISPGIKAVPVAPRTKALQMDAWNDLGGKALLERLRSQRDGIVARVRAIDRRAPLTALYRIRPNCEDIGRTALDAYAYFRVPDARAQMLWQRFILNAAAATVECRKAFDHLSAGRSKDAVDAFRTSFREIGAAYSFSTAIDSRVEEVRRAGRI
ncbi:M48 family metallopeptidase [Streptomyces sp. A1-5]|uniref:M48 family metallopeptidase n=1 Tax=Streptomyces sp. A1-5 TaxID=2738410 RepID=UPI001F16FF32|nr:M48 family metalloprotease [Streptomyces sp. A1-5]UJB40271.1 M48 family metalloprotease [Streptomyces sp. A1-5]